MLDSSLAACGGCGARLDPAENGGITRCGCGTETRFFLFPALFVPARVASSGELLQGEGEAACYLHEKKRAASACERCGRFVCELCHIQWGNGVICPACLNAAEKRSDELVQSRQLPDTVALALACSSLLVFYFGLISAPISLTLAIKSLRKPNSVVPRTRIRAWLAIIVSVLQIVGWSWLILYLIFSYKVK